MDNSLWHLHHMPFVGVIGVLLKGLLLLLLGLLGLLDDLRGLLDSGLRLRGGYYGAPWGHNLGIGWGCRGGDDLNCPIPWNVDCRHSSCQGGGHCH